jgi:hypothetical protein
LPGCGSCLFTSRAVKQRSVALSEAGCGPADGRPASPSPTDPIA